MAKSDGGVNCGLAITARRKALWLNQEGFSRAACINTHSLREAERGVASDTVILRIYAALMVLESGGTFDEARQASLTTKLPHHDPCIECGGPVPKHRNCSIAKWLAQKFCTVGCRLASEESAGFPEFTGSTLRGDVFSKHNVKTNDAGFIRINRPQTHVETQSSMGGL